jgi:hypothetical protein
MKTLKEWMTERGIEAGITSNAVFAQMRRGARPWPKMKRKNARVIYVIDENKHLKVS